MIKAYKYRIYPTKKQEIEFENNIEACCSIWNWALAPRYEDREIYLKSLREGVKIKTKILTYWNQTYLFTKLRNENHALKKYHYGMCADIINRVYKAQKNNLSGRATFPHFKGKYKPISSFTFPKASKNLITETGNKLSLVEVPKIGKVKIFLDRPLPEGKIKTLQIIRKQSHWYAAISIEIADVPKKEISSIVGVDVGLESFLTTSEGEKENPPRYLRKAEKKLILLQRKASRRKLGSNRRRKANRNVARLHGRIADRRKDFYGKVAHKLYFRYDTVGVEDLQIRNMVKNRHVAKSISDAGWGNFVHALENKAESEGCRLIKVPPQYTSQICSRCGEIVQKTLSVRMHKCDKCNLVLDRDHNAAINIRNRVASTLRGGNTADCTRKSLKKGKSRETSKSKIQLF